MIAIIAILQLHEVLYQCSSEIYKYKRGNDEPECHGSNGSFVLFSAASYRESLISEGHRSDCALTRLTMTILLSGQ